MQTYTLGDLNNYLNHYHGSYKDVAGNMSISDFWNRYQKFLEALKQLSTKIIILISGKQGYFKQLGVSNLGPLSLIKRFIGYDKDTEKYIFLEFSVDEIFEIKQSAASRMNMNN